MNIFWAVYYYPVNIFIVIICSQYPPVSFGVIVVGYNVSNSQFQGTRVFYVNFLSERLTFFSQIIEWPLFPSSMKHFLGHL